ncbi:lysophospholipid acyltransferase family protein [Amphibacillus sp. Q70]|uniref:lysophospholipid acyltransferase family protein n=1 Tax=Amphibacillus sp. Q70 TaxID=3453416 RepID=UPI003F85E563
MFIRLVTKLSGYLPQKLVKYIANSIINKFINKYAHRHIEDYENLKDVTKPIIFICNHLSNADGLVLNKVLSKESITFVSGVKLSNDSYTKLGVMALDTLPIIPNAPDRAGLKKIVKLLNDKNNILIFPEGTRSRNGSMLEAKKGVVLIQKLTNASIVPIGLTGTEKLLPINDEDMAKEKFQYATVNVKIGKWIDIQSNDGSETKKEYETRVLNTLMTSIAALLPKEYRGVYSHHSTE